jgi:hypothetical protein
MNEVVCAVALVSFITGWCLFLLIVLNGRR